MGKGCEIEVRMFEDEGVEEMEKLAASGKAVFYNTSDSEDKLVDSDFFNKYVIQGRIDRIMEELCKILPMLPKPIVIESYGIKYAKLRIDSVVIAEGSVRLGQIIQAMQQIRESLSGNWQMQEDGKWSLAGDKPIIDEVQVSLVSLDAIFQ